MRSMDETTNLIHESATRLGCAMSHDAAREIAHQLFDPPPQPFVRERFEYDAAAEDIAARAWLEG